MWKQIADYKKTKERERTERAKLRQTEHERRNALDMVGSMDWDPELASEHIGPYQRSQSPVAQGFLESLLTGSNPSAVQGTRLGAQGERAAKQQDFNRQYGGWDALRARQREIEAATPWAVKPFSDSEQQFSTPQPLSMDERKTADRVEALKGLGITPEIDAALQTRGIKLGNTGVDSAWQNMEGRTLGFSGKTDDYARLGAALASGDEDLARRIARGAA